MIVATDHVVIIDQSVDDGFLGRFDRGGEKRVHQIVRHGFDGANRGFGVGGIIYSLIISRLLRLFGQNKLMIAGGVLQGAGIMAMALQPSWQVQLGVFIMFGCAFYLLHGAIQIFVTELAPSARSSAAAAHSTFFFTGQSIGPVFYRFGFYEAGLMPSLLFGGLMLMINGIVCASFLRQRPR